MNNRRQTNTNGKTGLRRKIFRRPAIEALEDRTLLSSYFETMFSVRAYAEVSNQADRDDFSIEREECDPISASDTGHAQKSGSAGDNLLSVDVTSSGSTSFAKQSDESRSGTVSFSASVEVTRNTTSSFPNGAFTGGGSWQLEFRADSDGSFSYDYSASEGGRYNGLSIRGPGVSRDLNATGAGSVSIEKGGSYTIRVSLSPNGFGGIQATNLSLENSLDWQLDALVVCPDDIVTDITVSPPTIHEDNSASFTYTIDGGPLRQPTSVEVYWETYREGEYRRRLGKAIISAATATEVGVYQVDIPSLGERPDEATHLFVLADSGRVVEETNEENNSADLELERTNLVALDLVKNPDGSYSYSYEVTDRPLPVPTTVDLYWADDDLKKIGWQNVDYDWIYTRDGVGAHRVDVASLGERPEGATHLILVADERDYVAESNEDDNLVSLRLDNAPNLAVSAPIVSTDGAASFGYTIAGTDLESPASVVVYWVDENLDTLGTIASVMTPTARGDYDFSVPAVGSPPDGATRILVRADPSGAVAEPDEGDNDESLRVIFAPDVKLRIDPEEGPYKNESYYVMADVTNNSLVPQTFTLELIETPRLTGVDRVDGFFQEGTYPARSVALDGKEQASVELAIAIQQWDWIPRENPVTGPFSALGEIYSAFKETAFTVAAETAGDLASKLTALGAAFVQIDGVYKDIVDAPVRAVEFGYSVSVAEAPGVAEPLSVVVTVPDKYRFFHNISIAALNAGKYLLGKGIQTLLIEPPASLPLFAGAAVSYTTAALLYNQAVDPPDPNYKELATARAPVVAEIEAMPAGPLKDFALLGLELQGVRDAEAASRDRALGARDAGDPAWESAQLIAASGFAARAAVLGARFNDLRALVAPADGAGPQTGDDVVAYLRDNGLPEFVVTSLKSLGWSLDQIDALSSNLLQVDAEAFEPAGDDVASQLPTYFSAATAIAELGEGIQLRVDELGEAVRALSTDERDGLDAMRANIEAGLGAGPPSEALVQSINTYVAEARRLALETNNFDAVQDDLDFGYGALVDYQRLDASPSGIRSYVEQLISEGRIPGPVAEPLLEFLDQAEHQLSEGRPADALASLAGFVDAVRTESGAGVPADVAEELVGLAAYVGGFLGSLPALAVTGMTVNDGDAQRSSIETVSIRFNQATNLQSLIDDGSITGLVQLAALTESESSVRLSSDHFRWNAADNLLLVDLTIDGFGGSRQTLLSDGKYEIRLADLVSIRNPGAIDKFLTETDGDDDGRLAFAFHCLYGDTDGDGDVDNSDYFAFRSAAGKSAGQSGYLWYLDALADGSVDVAGALSDYQKFLKNFRKVLA